jgi:transposase
VCSTCKLINRAYGVQNYALSINLSLLAVLGMEGFLAAHIYTGSTNQFVFIDFFRTFILPVIPPGSVVVMDNHSAHHGEACIMLREMLSTINCFLAFLPPYSPDLNPIENAFGTIKTLIKRNRLSYWIFPQGAILAAVDQINRNQIRGWYTHCGYVRRT